MDCSKDASCVNKDEALRLKIAGIVSILVASAIGVALPLIAKNFSRSRIFFFGQCFAAGVILATGFVHILPDAFEALGNPCLSEHPWGKFPFAGFIAMTTAMLTLLVDSVAVGYFFHRAEAQAAISKPEAAAAGQALPPPHGPHAPHRPSVDRVHSEPPDEQDEMEMQAVVQQHGHHHGHSHATPGVSETVRRKVIAQVLEFGILAHSVIIGISMGASESPCTVRPLVGALVFHQLFEGIALGGCITMGDFKNFPKLIMSFFFSITTPAGIAIGIAILSRYNENDPKALIVQGIFDSMSAGILVYMALVDLLATHFLNEEFLRRSSIYYLLAYSSLFIGAGAMSVLAIWA